MGDFIYDCGRARCGAVLEWVRTRESGSESESTRPESESESESIRPESESIRCESESIGPESESESESVRPESESERWEGNPGGPSSRSPVEKPHRFKQSKSGEFNIPQQELEDHLRGCLYRFASWGTDGRHCRFGQTIRTRRDILWIRTQNKVAEVERFIYKARVASAPGPNGILYKVNKKCEELKKLLWRLLKVFGRQGVVPLSWNKADGVYIPKEENWSTLSQFRPISLLNVEGKIVFGILAERLSTFVLQNGLILCKRLVAGSPGCVEHTSMIWRTIQDSKKLRRNSKNELKLKLT